MKYTHYTVPAFMWERELFRGSGALQLLMALYIQDEDHAREVFSEEDMKQRETTHAKIAAWAAMMRRELASTFKEDMKSAMRLHGWELNTHPGFALGMVSSPHLSVDALSVFEEFEVFCHAYVQGEGPWIPVSSQKDFVSQWLHERQYSWALEDSEVALQLKLALNHASADRLCQGHPTQPVWVASE